MPKINVTIVDVTGQKEQKADLPDDAPIRQIVSRLITMMGLPTTSPDGQTMSYKFHNKTSGKQLDDNKTLGEQGVKDGDVLRLIPEMVAGVSST